MSGRRVSCDGGGDRLRRSECRSHPDGGVVLLSQPAGPRSSTDRADIWYQLLLCVGPAGRCAAAWSASNGIGLSHDYTVDDGLAEALFIGVGIDHYAHLPELVGSADEVQTIAELVGEHFAARLLRDADEAAIGTVCRSMCLSR